MAKITALTETDLVAVKRANDALLALHNLTVEFCDRHHITDADIERLRAIEYNVGAAMQMFKLYLQRVNKRGRGKR